MHVQIEDLDVEIIRTTSETEDAFGGRPGWFWEDSQRGARGPFPTAAEALSNFAAWFARRAKAVPLDALTEPLDLVAHHLDTAEGFLRGPADPQAPTAADLQALCVGLELTLNAWLISRGVSDDDCRTALGHHLDRAYRTAALLGLPDEDDARVKRFAGALSTVYATHGLDGLTTGQMQAVLSNGTPLALRFLHRSVKERVYDDLADGLVHFRPSISLVPSAAPNESVIVSAP
jgi:hypothetical protein